ncbi:DUF2254 domain-containing protein [Aquiflexum sp. TKW24L]|uniref:DUF2254 domain-containing protein n=1 Tax=Aquiflexum sp. TKW24L TaxID=2942212 RepID=UPI0020BE90F0|nr:DUF2254 domain-containing protein [Aquiflexum sp. TKW24L]MCL6261314.1 DUF2254 domain-containing protein [Aquiflexum sp. TKW24L]
MKKMLFQWSELKATFWFVPVIIIILSILLSIGLVYLDGLIDISQDGIARLFLVNSSDSARTILSTISGAMMGVAGTVFSITLVALTLASSQFGPRLIKNFMYVRLNQVVLGSYVSTYLYCLLVLNAVKAGDDYTFIPSISILVAIVAAITNIVLLIVFIHRIATSIQADHVISDISDFISKQVQTLFPEKMGEEKESEANMDISKVISAYSQRISIKCSKSGYLQYIDGENLVEIISKNDSLLDIFHRPGSHLVEGIEIGTLYTTSIWEEEELEKINKQLVIGKTKTSQQDLEYSVHQMVEIAVRALSPGVNDPYTALACIDNLTATMSYLAQAKFPSKYRYDEEGNLRVIADVIDFEGVLDAAFNQIRQFSEGSPAVIIRLMEALITIGGFTNERHKKAVVKHAEMVLNNGKRTIEEENDLQDLIKRSEKILN